MIKFAFELVDRASATANRIASALDHASKALAKADEKSSLSKLERGLGRLRGSLDRAGFGVRVAFGDKAADLLARFTKGELKTADKAEIVRAGLGAISKGMGTVASGAILAASGLAAVTMAAVGLGAAGGQMLLDAQRFRDTTGFALRFALGTGQAATETMVEVQRIANLLGVSTEQSMASFRELESSGFNTRESKILLQMVADLKAVSGGRDVAISALSEPLQALKRNEALTVASFKGLEAAGMSQNKVYSVLAKNLGVAVGDPTDTNKIKRDVDRALAQRMLRGQKAVDFWSKVNLDALGEEKLGDKTKEFQDTTVTGALDKLQNRWDALVASVDSSPLGASLVTLLNRLSDALDTRGGGKELLATLNQIVGLAAQGYDYVKRLIEPFASGLGAGFSSALKDAMEFVALFTRGSSVSAEFSSGLKAVGKALGTVLVGAGLLVAGMIWLTTTIVEAFVTLPANLRAIGRDMIAGLGEGIESMKSWLVAKVKGLAGMLPESVRKLLQIRSPSRVMAQLGAYSAEGFAAGIEREAPRVQSAASAGLAAPTVRGASAHGEGARGQVTVSPGAVQITVQGGSMDEEALARMIEARLRALLLDMNLELGVAPA